MDVFFRYRNQRFIWDGQKAIANRTKHGIAFETACEAFFDDLALYVEATADSERRSAVFGLSRTRKLLYVVHMERDEDQIRLISAREATKKERKFYENG